MNQLSVPVVVKSDDDALPQRYLLWYHRLRDSGRNRAVSAVVAVAALLAGG